MIRAIYSLLLLLSVNILSVISFENEYKQSTILVALFARNKQHILPYFLTQFENLNYPKDRMSLYIRSDHNTDRTVEILKSWVNYHNESYHSIDVVYDQPTTVLSPNEMNPTNWTFSRFRHIINLKNDAFHKARNIWADYIWFLDTDAILVGRDILNNLIATKKPIVAPMLNSLGTYSNYWCGMTESYWYKRTSEYLPILERKNIGCFEVPMVHSSVLIDMTLSLSDHLSFSPESIPGYNGPYDDIIAFAVNARHIGFRLHVCNDVGLGFIPPPLKETDNLNKDLQQLVDLKLAVIVKNEPLKPSALLENYVPNTPKDQLGFDNIYLINLARRPDRKERMYANFDELGLNVSYFEAYDGKSINSTYLENLGVKQLNDYKDPYSKRDLTFGEIGCFLSHYFIWKDIIHKGYKQAIIFEDDILFEPYFRDTMDYLMDHISDIRLEWDLIYLGRKILQDSDELWVDGSNMLVHPGYSYWTLGYIITLEGAKKLFNPQALSKMVPVDEYIPIMFDKHPESGWKHAFSDRNLKAFSVSPLMISPTHYSGDKGYISDTENSIPLHMEPGLMGHETFVKTEL